MRNDDEITGLDRRVKTGRPTPAEVCSRDGRYYLDGWIAQYVMRYHWYARLLDHTERVDCLFLLPPGSEGDVDLGRRVVGRLVPVPEPVGWNTCVSMELPEYTAPWREPAALLLDKVVPTVCARRYAHDARRRGEPVFALGRATTAAEERYRATFHWLQTGYAVEAEGTSYRLAAARACVLAALPPPPEAPDGPADPPV